MKKIVTGALLLTSLVFSGNVDGVMLKKFKTLKPLDAKEVNIKDAEKIGSIYVLRLSIAEPQGSRVIPAVVTEDLKNVIIGSAYDSKTGLAHSTMNLAQFDKNAVFTLGKSNKNGTFYLFTDPDCPACKNFDENMKRDIDKYAIQIKVMFFPLDRIHPEARKKSEYILTLPETERKEAYEKMGAGDMAWKTAKISPEVKTAINGMVELGKDLGLKGTPSIYGPEANEVDLNVFYGYLRALEKKEKGEVNQ